MAIYHFSMQRISRGKGKSAVGSSAYRAGEKLENERDGLTHDYTKRNDVVHKEIIAPYNAPKWTGDREKLWNEVERSEKRKDANTAREINIALPKELNREKQIELVRNFVQENFTEKKIIADIAIHDKQDGNPHAHIMITTRAINENGFDNKKISYMDDKETLEKWRENWAKEINKSLEKENIKDRVDHRSFEDQGIEKIPTKHEGQAVRAMEKKGIETEIGSYNRQAEIANKQIQLLKRQIAVLEMNLEYDRIENKVKKREALKMDIKLPEELNREKQIELVRNFVQENFTDKKIRADVAIYNKQDEKQHVQIIINTRAINKDGLRENWAKAINKILEKENIKKFEDNPNPKDHIADLQERRTQLINHDAKLMRLKEEREDLKFYQIMQKKVIDEKIKEINQLKASDIESLNKNHKIKPNEIDSLIKKMEDKQDKTKVSVKDKLQAIKDSRKEPIRDRADPKDQIADLKERQKQLINHDAEISLLEIQREKLKFFQTKEKNVIDEKIKEINQLDASDRESLNQIYKIQPYEIDKLIRTKEEQIREPEPEKLTMEEWKMLIKKGLQERQKPPPPEKTKERGGRDDR
jgi:hypothetical protein